MDRKILSHLLFLLALHLFVGCGNDVASSHDVASYSAGSESSALEESSSSAHNVVSELSSDDAHISSAEMLPMESSSSLQVSSSAEESSSSGDTEWSSSSMSQGCTGPACYLYSSSSSSLSSSMMIVYGEMTDERDGQTYKTITIDGRATWMAENLNYAYLQPTAELDSSSWCYFDTIEGCNRYGRYYLWSAMIDSAGIFSDKTKGCGYFVTKDGWKKCPVEGSIRGVCPEGWRLPTYKDYQGLMFWRHKASLGVDFGEHQLQNAGCYDESWNDEMSRGLVGSSNFWLVDEKNFEEGIIDAYVGNSLGYSESGSIYEVFITPKTRFSAVRCVKDEEL